MSIERIANWKHPRINLSREDSQALREVAEWIKTHYLEHEDESIDRIQDFENITINTSTFNTLKVTSLTDGYVPYHVSDAIGFDDSTIYTDASNFGLGVTAFGTSAAKVIGLGNGTAPTTAPANMIQLWSADRSAGYAQAHYRAEGGVARPLQQVYNVMDYGATGDGATDDTTAILALITLVGARGGGDIFFPFGEYLTSSLIDVDGEYVTLIGEEGPPGKVSQITSSSTTGAIRLGAVRTGLINFGIKYTGSGAYGVKIYNDNDTANFGADRCLLRNLRIEGTAGTTDGLWLVNTVDSHLDNINLSGGVGKACFLESAIECSFTHVYANSNVVESPTPLQWGDGLILGVLTGSSFHSYGNRFYSCNFTATKGDGLRLEDTVAATGQPSGLNSFYSCTFEGNGTSGGSPVAYNVNIEHGAKNYFYNLFTSAGGLGETIIQNISYGNVFFGGQTNVELPNPGGAQYAQGNQFIGLAGQVDIQHANVFGTILLGVWKYIDNGTSTLILQTGIGDIAGNCTLEFRVPDIKFDDKRHIYASAAPTTGSWGHGSIIWNSGIVEGGSPGWVCFHAGTFGTATDGTGDTDGSTAVITGMADTSDFAVGNFVDVSAGFATTGPYEVKELTATTMTLGVNSTSAQSNITVDTSNPTFVAMLNLLDTSENFGLGTNTPTAKLDIVGTKAGIGTFNNGMLEVRDDTAMAANVGGGIMFWGKYTNGGDWGHGGSVATYKINATSGNYAFGLQFNTRANGSNPAVAMTLTDTKNMGLGTSTFGTSAVGVLGIANGTVPSTSPAGMIQLFSVDSSDGATNATLGLRTEQAVEDIGTFTASKKLKIWINGVEYWIQLDAV